MFSKILFTILLALFEGAVTLIEQRCRMFVCLFSVVRLLEFLFIFQFFNEALFLKFLHLVFCCFKSVFLPQQGIVCCQCCSILGILARGFIELAVISRNDTIKLLYGLLALVKLCILVSCHTEKPVKF